MLQLCVGKDAMMAKSCGAAWVSRVSCTHRCGISVAQDILHGNEEAARAAAAAAASGVIGPPIVAAAPAATSTAAVTAALGEKEVQSTSAV